MQKLSQKLTELRKNKGLTQKQLAEKINYSDKVISKWERGDSVPDVAALSAVARFFDITLDEILGSCEVIKPTINSELRKAGRMLHILLSLLPLLCSVLYLCLFGYSYFNVKYVHNVFSVLTATPLCLLAVFCVVDMVLCQMRIWRTWVVYIIFGIICLLGILLIITCFIHGTLVSLSSLGLNIVVYAVLAAVVSCAFGFLFNKG